MKFAMYSLVAVATLALSSGCCLVDRFGCRTGGCATGCASCGASDCGGGCGGGSSCGSGLGHGGGAACGCGYAGYGYDDGRYAAYSGCYSGKYGKLRGPYSEVINPGPMGPQVTYPYYTNRGPRDFLAANPRGIGN